MRLITVKDYLEKLQNYVNENPETAELPVYFNDGDSKYYPLEIGFEGLVHLHQY